MATTVPPCLRSLAPILKRAEECDRMGARNPDFLSIAYLLRMAAVTTGSQAQPDAQGEAFLLSLMNDLEAAKPGSGVTNENEEQCMDKLHQYGLTVFKKADDVDRAGAADASTANVFIAASNILEARRALGSVDPQLTSMIKYAKGRTVEIAKAVKEGIPVPPPQGASDFYLMAAMESVSAAAPAAAAPASSAVLPPPVFREPSFPSAPGPASGPSSNTLSAALRSDAYPPGGYGGYGSIMTPQASPAQQMDHSAAYVAGGGANPAARQSSAPYRGQEQLQQQQAQAAFSQPQYGAPFQPSPAGVSAPPPFATPYYPTGSGGGSGIPMAQAVAPSWQTVPVAGAGAAVAAPAPQASRRWPTTSGGSGGQAGNDPLQDSKEYTKHALAALKADEPGLAVDFLRKALAALGSS